MKYVLLILSLFLLASCQSQENPNNLSKETGVFSLDTSEIFIEDDTIYFREGMTQEEFLSDIIARDESVQTYRFLTNDGSVKTRQELFEYEKLEVISEDGVYKKVYTLFYITN